MDALMRQTGLRQVRHDGGREEPLHIGKPGRGVQHQHRESASHAATARRPCSTYCAGGPGGFKTTSVGIPTMLTWCGAAVVLDPSREIGPMVQAYRQEKLGHHVVTLDPADPGFRGVQRARLDRHHSPEAETNVEAAVNWICGETRGQVTSGAEFFDVNAEMVRQGAAWVYRQYDRDPSLLRLEQEARDARRGLWALPEAERCRHGNGVPPRGPVRIQRAQPTSDTSSPEWTRCERLHLRAKRYCREMTNCAEARFYLTKCGLTRLDADGNGVPCESICR